MNSTAVYNFNLNQDEPIAEEIISEIDSFITESLTNNVITFYYDLIPKVLTLSYIQINRVIDLVIKNYREKGIRITMSAAPFGSTINTVTQEQYDQWTANYPTYLDSTWLQDGYFYFEYTNMGHIFRIQLFNRNQQEYMKAYM